MKTYPKIAILSLIGFIGFIGFISHCLFPLYVFLEMLFERVGMREVGMLWVMHWRSVDFQPQAMRRTMPHV
jgi:hypothetical protein